MRKGRLVHVAKGGEQGNGNVTADHRAEESAGDASVKRR